MPVSNGLARRAGAEAIGTAFLVAAVIGSGIAAQRLSPHDVGLQLLVNSLITGAALVALILALQLRPRWLSADDRAICAPRSPVARRGRRGGSMPDLDAISIATQHRDGGRWSWPPLSRIIRLFWSWRIASRTPSAAITAVLLGTAQPPFFAAFVVTPPQHVHWRRAPILPSPRRRSSICNRK
jgi:hypothetical protein